MDERLQLLADQGADITIKLRRQNAFVQIRIKDDTFKASGGTLVKATDRVLDAYHSKTTSIRKERRNKEREREMILDGENEYGTLY